MTVQCCPRHPGKDPSLPHQIILKFPGGRAAMVTRVTCNCGADLGTYPPGDLDAMLGAYRAHQPGEAHSDTG